MRSDVREDGPCLTCGKATVYRIKHQSIREEANRPWLFQEWRTPVKFSLNKQGRLRVNKKKVRNISPYLCSDCYQQVRAVQGNLRDHPQHISPKPNTAAARKMLRALPYDAYLQSDHWHGVRAAVLKDRNYTCQRCQRELPAHLLQVHHIVYTHRGRELDAMNTLELLCVSCHQLEHPGKPNLGAAVASGTMSTESTRVCAGVSSP